MSNPWVWLFVGYDMALSLTDALVDKSFALTGAFIVAPLALAAIAAPLAVTLVALLSAVLAVASGIWDDFFLSTDHAVRAGTVFVGGLLAVRAAHARESSEIDRRHMQLLADAARLTSGEGGADALLARITALLVPSVADVAAVDVFAAGGELERVRVKASGPRAAEIEAALLHATPWEDDAPLSAARAARTGESQFLHVGDHALRERIAASSADRKLGAAMQLRSTIILPLASSGRKLGALLLGVGHSGRSFTAADLAFFESLSGRVSLALGNARLIEELTISEQRERFLADASELLSSSLDYEKTLTQVAKLAVPNLSDWCAVDVLDAGGQPQLVALAHIDPEKVELGRELRQRYPPEGDEGLMRVLAGGESELYPTIGDELLVAGARDEAHLEVLRTIGMRAAMLIPMKVGPSTIGVISFVSSQPGRSFDLDDLALAEELARRAAIAVENARIYGQRASVAQTLQESLLPEALPEVPGWSFATLYRPGGAEVDVGGDFYDVFAVEGGWMVVIGDVTGKGVHAAALTSLARHTIRTAAVFDPAPSAVLGLLNRILLEQPTMSVCTALCARLVPGTPVRATFASAGHPLPVRLRAGGAEDLGRFGTLLGAFDGGRWPEVSVDVEDGDTLVMYTDGVTDASGPGGRFGEERLMRLLAESGGEPTDVARSVDRALSEWAAERDRDDTAVVAMRLAPGGRERSPLAPPRDAKSRVGG
ncbi:MAG: hypothetical protein NVSMB25_14550 [Thermoleophilaceae bacterium]